LLDTDETNPNFDVLRFDTFGPQLHHTVVLEVELGVADHVIRPESPEDRVHAGPAFLALGLLLFVDGL